MLLREALHSTGKMAICRVTIRMREHLAGLIADGEALTLIILRFAHELKGREEFEFPARPLEELKISSKELSLAQRLVDEMVTEWDPARYHDTYREHMLGLITEKLEKGEVQARPEERGERPGRVIDIVTLLKKSVEEKQKRGGRKPKGSPKGSRHAA